MLLKRLFKDMYYSKANSICYLKRFFKCIEKNRQGPHKKNIYAAKMKKQMNMNNDCSVNKNELT